MPRENKYLKLEELEVYAYANGALLDYYSPTGVFTLRDRLKSESWVWIINPYTKDRVKRVRELDKSSWIYAIEDALKRLRNDSEASSHITNC